MRIKRFNKADKEWAKFIYNNRRGKCKSNRYDLVIGPIADNGIEVLFQELEHGNKTNEEWENLAKKIIFKKVLFYSVLLQNRYGIETFKV